MAMLLGQELPFSPQSSATASRRRARPAASSRRRSALSAATLETAAVADGSVPFSDEQLAARRRGLGPPLGEYSPEALAAELSTEPWTLASRVAAVGAALGAVALSVAFDAARGSDCLRRNERARARQLRQALTSLGVTFVKAGQALSTRPDLLPAVYLEELAVRATPQRFLRSSDHANPCRSCKTASRASPTPRRSR